MAEAVLYAAFTWAGVAVVTVIAVVSWLGIGSLWRHDKKLKTQEDAPPVEHEP